VPLETVTAVASSARAWTLRGLELVSEGVDIELSPESTAVRIDDPPPHGAERLPREPRAGDAGKPGGRRRPHLTRWASWSKQATSWKCPLIIGSRMFEAMRREREGLAMDRAAATEPLADEDFRIWARDQRPSSHHSSAWAGSLSSSSAPC
jgi:hypothetical protein